MTPSIPTPATNMLEGEDSERAGEGGGGGASDGDGDDSVQLLEPARAPTQSPEQARDVSPVTLPYVPSGQSVHVASPPLLKRPVGQASVHEGLSARARPKRPAAHSPAHSTPFSPLTSPIVSPYRPAGQSLHAIDPRELAYLPFSQSIHALAPSSEE